MGNAGMHLEHTCNDLTLRCTDGVVTSAFLTKVKTMELNRIKLLLRDLAHSHGLTDDDLNHYNELENDNDWHIDWGKNLSDSFNKRMQLLEAAVNLYDKALKNGDRLTAKAGLIRAGIHLQSLTTFFDGMTHDVKKAYGDPRFDWPTFPDDNWKISPEYGFKE